jgi:hypothetical protein
MSKQDGEKKAFSLFNNQRRFGVETRAKVQNIAF